MGVINGDWFMETRYIVRATRRKEERESTNLSIMTADIYRVSEARHSKPRVKVEHVSLSAEGPLPFLKQLRKISGY